MGAHHGLHRLAQDFPGAIQILGDPRCVELDLLQARGQRLISEHRVTDRDTEIAQHRRVGQVALQRDTGSLSAKWPSSALANPKLPSAFSKSMGLTLCGMVEEPTSPATSRCLK